MNKDLSFITSDGEKLSITTYFDENAFSGKIFVFIHGFKGFKDWGFGPFLSGYFANKGFFVVTFNFSHNGVGENKLEFTELEKFAKNTFSREVRELDELLDAIKGGLFQEIDCKSKIGLIGHSRGGAIALLTSAKRNDICAISTWAAISKLDRHSSRQKEEWKKKGYLEILNTRTNQKMKLYTSLLEDLEFNIDNSLNLQKAIENLSCPLLIAHGNMDMAVPIKEAEQLYEWADKSKTELFKIYGTGHTFNIVHPFESSNDKFEKLLNKTNEFFIKNLN